ncbi:MAG: SMP-30/gluconolactonase/LRE family protein [Pseudomonadota bacterium]
MSTATTLCDIVCTLGEGPTYDAATDTIYWFDILGRRLLEKTYPDGRTIVHDLPLMASALFRIDARRQLAWTETGFHVRDRATGDLVLHTPVEADNPATRSNDARAHPSGSIWAGTMGKKAERHAGAIYWFRKGEVRILFPDITIPNSICFSPDGRTGYFADTAKNILFRVACDPATGLPTGEPAVLLDHRGKPGGIDGSVCDADGVIWNARWGSSCVDAYAADGRHLRSVPAPATQSSCPAFVGRDFSRLAVTTACEGMDEEARRADPGAGMLYLLDVEVKGRPEPDVLI